MSLQRYLAIALIVMVPIDMPISSAPVPFLDPITANLITFTATQSIANAFMQSTLAMASIHQQKKIQKDRQALRDEVMAFNAMNALNHGGYHQTISSQGRSEPQAQHEPSESTPKIVYVPVAVPVSSTRSTSDPSEASTHADNSSSVTNNEKKTSSSTSTKQAQHESSFKNKDSKKTVKHSKSENKSSKGNTDDSIDLEDDATIADADDNTMKKKKKSSGTTNTRGSISSVASNMNLCF